MVEKIKEISGKQKWVSIEGHKIDLDKEVNDRPESAAVGPFSKQKMR